ncbi:MAG: hypothetical protein ACREF7_01155 [Candidatus Saccharimonadales bacterium]
MTQKLKQIVIVVISLSFLVMPAAAFASSTPTLNQTINAGTLTTNIYQTDDQTPVVSPSVSFPAVNYGFACQTTSATLGDSSDKINVTNLANGINTWTLSIAATGGDSATWSDGSGHTYAYNSSVGSGCTNGQLTVNASVGSITDDCNSNCADTNVTKGASTTYVSGTTSSATLMSDTTGTAWEGYLTGVNLSQKIPALSHSGSYTLGMTITVTNT